MASKTTARGRASALPRRRRRKKPTWEKLMQDLIGEEKTKQLIEDGTCSLYVPNKIPFTPDTFTVTLGGSIHGSRGYCIHAMTRFNQDGLNDQEYCLSLLYPKVALLMTNPNKFSSTSG